MDTQNQRFSYGNSATLSFQGLGVSTYLGTGHYLCGGGGGGGGEKSWGGGKPNFFKDKGWAKRKFHYDWGWVIV